MEEELPDRKEASTLKEKTTKGLFWGSLNSGFQQIMILFFGIFLARILKAHDYGMVGTLAIFTGISSVLIDSGFSTALINRKEVRHDDYNAVFWFSFGVGSLSYFILFFCAPLIATYFHNPELLHFSRVVFLWFLISSITVPHAAFMMKKMMQKERMKIELSAQIVSGVIGLSFAYAGFGYWSLAFQTVTHAVVGSLLRWYYVPWRPSWSFRMQPLKEMFPFGLKVMLTSVFSQINANIFSLLLARFYTGREVGYYTQGNKWMNIGYTFLWNMVGNVSLPVLTEVAGDIDRQRAVFRKILRFVSFIAFPSMLGLALIAREFILLTISAEWLPSVPVLQLLCIWGAVLPIGNLYTHVLLSRGKSNLYLYNTVALGAAQLLAIVGMLPFGIYYMVLAVALVNIGWLFVWHYFVNRLIRIRLIDVLKDVVPFLGITLFVLGISYATTMFIENMYLLLVARVLLAGALYCLAMYLTKSVIFKESVLFIKEYIIHRKNIRA